MWDTIIDINHITVTRLPVNLLNQEPVQLNQYWTQLVAKAYNHDIMEKEQS